VSWQNSSDGTRLIGHMLLKKDTRDSSLGLKVVGGQPLPHGGRGAIVEKVKRGSIAEREGGLRAGNFLRSATWPRGVSNRCCCCWLGDTGDEVIEWNGRSLQGKGYEQVYEIVSESRQEPQVELIVARQATPRAQQPHHHSATELWRQGNRQRTPAEQQLALLPGRPWFIIFSRVYSLSPLIQFDLAVHARLDFIQYILYI